MIGLRRFLAFFAAQVAWLAPCATSLAQDLSPKAPVLVRWDAPAGSGSFSPGSWGVLAVELWNPGDAPADLVVSAFFADDQNLQYAKRWWLPAHSKMTGRLPILVPRERMSLDAPRKLDSAPPPLPIKIKALLLDRSGAKEEVRRGPRGEMVHDGTLSLSVSATLSHSAYFTDPSPLTPTVGPSRSPSEDEDLGRPALFLTSARRAAGLDDRITPIFDPQAPENGECFENLRQILLANDRLAENSVGLAATREWVFQGGRLWVMLDRVSPATVERLLGSSFDWEIVDRARLTQVTFEDNRPAKRLVQVPTTNFESPVEMVRVLVDDEEVLEKVDGWPVAFWQDYGHGRILFTTLGGRGWFGNQAMEARVSISNPGAPNPPAGQGSVGQGLGGSPGSPTAALVSLAQDFFATNIVEKIDDNRFRPTLAEHIGYRTLPRTWVLGVLGGFCVCLIGGAVWLKRLEKSAWLALLGPLLAIGAATTLVLQSNRTRQAVPPTLAYCQLAEIEPGAEEVQVRGLMGVYYPEASDFPVGGRRGGFFEIDPAGLDGVTRRALSLDSEKWQWENLHWPEGLKFSPFRQSFRASAGTPDAVATLGPDGVSGRLTLGPFREVSDAVIATGANHHLAVQLESDGTFHASAKDVLAADQFVASAFLSDEQRRRQSIYREAKDAGWLNHADRPTLLFWAKPLDLGFSFPEEMQTVGATLASIPLRFEPIPPATSVTIPAPLLSYRPVTGPDGEGQAPAYNALTAEWQERATLAKTWLRFQIPREILPFQLEGATLTAEISGPAVQLEILGAADGKAIPLATRSNPIGRITIEIDDPATLNLDAEGGFLLGVNAGGTKVLSGGGVTNYWKIESLELEARGQTR